MSLYEAAAEIVLAALDLAGIARDEFVEEKTRGNPALQKEVRSLLAAHSRSEGFLEQPTTIGAFKILGLLGEGGMGTVYLAEDTRLGRKVALKAIARQFSNDEHSRERLRREARAAAGLVHPGIAIVYALEEIDGSLFIVSEHIQGETLRDAIADGPLPLKDVLAIGRCLAEAMAAAHDSGVIHRDLKPENVMRARDGSVKILDFGLAKAIGADAAMAEAGAPALTAAFGTLGTPGYMSPEQLRGEPATPASDIFALGVLLAEIASGRHPFGGERGTATMARILTAEPELAGVPASLRLVIDGAIAKRPDDRFRSAHELRAAIDAIAHGEAPRRIDHSTQFWWWQFHQAGACLFSATLLVAVWLSPESFPRAQADYVLIGAVLGAASATTLRLFNWFRARTQPSEPSARAIAVGARVGDVILAVAAFVAGYHERAAHPVAAALLMASAVVMPIISIVIEPETARAAKR